MPKGHKKNLKLYLVFSHFLIDCVTCHALIQKLLINFLIDNHGLNLPRDTGSDGVKKILVVANISIIFSQQNIIHFYKIHFNIEKSKIPKFPN